MKYIETVTINKDRETVLKLIQDPTHFKDWMDGLDTYNILEKTDGEGTRTELVFKDKKGKETKMIETVESLSLPDEIVTSYNLGKVKNKCINRFIEEDGATIYEMESSFDFGFFTNLFIWMFKGVFSKQTLSGMNKFKEFVETKE